MERQIDDLIVRCHQSAWNYYRKKRKFEEVKQKYEQIKAEFEMAMLELTDAMDSKNVSFKPDKLSNGERLVVRKVEKTSIEWDADKLESKLPKSVAKKVIKKQYRITDMQGLIEYLKACNVNPQIFKKYIAIERTVDVKAVDQLGELGEISVQQISGCYVVKCHKPYFTLSVKKDDDGDGKQK